MTNVVSTLTRFIACALVLGMSSCGESQFWVDSVQVEYPDSTNIPAVVLYGVEASGRSLTGKIAYNNRSVGNRSSEKITLTGKRSGEDKFWPRAQLLVADDINGGWERIGKTPLLWYWSHFSMRPNTYYDQFRVDLGPFRTFVDKYNWGKIVLENGEAATFSLQQLLPPEQRKTAGTGR